MAKQQEETTEPLAPIRTYVDEHGFLIKVFPPMPSLDFFLYDQTPTAKPNRTLALFT